MTTRQTDIDDFELRRERAGSGAGALLTSTLVAAAVGAGIALLLAPEKGVKTRRRLKKRIGGIDLAAPIRKLRGEASSRWEELQEGVQEEIEHQLNIRRRSPRREATIGVLGTLVGAGVALLLAPEGGLEMRERLGRSFRGLKDEAESRLHAHRQQGDTAESGSSERSRGSGDGDSNRAPRSVQDLGREAEESTVF